MIGPLTEKENPQLTSVIESVGGPERGIQRCFSDVTNQGCITAAMQTSAEQSWLNKSNRWSTTKIEARQLWKSTANAVWLFNSSKRKSDIEKKEAGTTGTAVRAPTLHHIVRKTFWQNKSMAVLVVQYWCTLKIKFPPPLLWKYCHCFLVLSCVLPGPLATMFVNKPYNLW